MASEARALAPARRSALWPCLLLALVLFSAKAVAWSLPEPNPKRLGEYVTDLSVSSHEDLLFALGLFALAETALVLSRRRPRLHAVAWWAFVAAGVASAVYAVASVQIFSYLRSPLTYRLLYLAGDAKTMRSSVGSFLSPGLVVAFVAVPLLWLSGALLAHRLPGPPRRAWIRLALVAALLAHAGWWRQVSLGRWGDRSDRLIAASPHWALVASFVAEIGGGGTPSLDVPVLAEDLREMEPPRAPGSTFRAAERPRNVVLVVLETTGTRYLGLYGSRYPTTPRLQAEAAHALVFDNVYTHVGLTANAMASLTLSLYPYMTWREYTVEHPDFPGTTLAELFRARGHRTAFLHPGDLGYVNQEGFLRNRGFQALLDMGELSPGQASSSWGAEDRVAVDGALRWLDEEPGAPFFLQIWTSQSHHPYEPSAGVPFIDFFAGGELPPDDYDLGRYLNTLHEMDAQMGRLFDGLRERGIADDTLVVLVGDHGEGFGHPHRTWGHGFRLYEEGIHVPFVVWNPRLVPEGRRLPTIGGHADVNPTVADLMGMEPAPSWRGRSLFDPARPPRTCFYAANDDYLLGLREGRLKYIYNVTTGREEVYDLEADPDEQTNLASTRPEAERARFRQRLAAWKEASGRHLAQATGPKPGQAGPAAAGPLPAP